MRTGDFQNVFSSRSACRCRLGQRSPHTQSVSIKRKPRSRSARRAASLERDLVQNERIEFKKLTSLEYFSCGSRGLTLSNACILCKFCKGRFGPDNTPRLAAKIKDRCARQTTRIPIKTPEGVSSRSMTPNSAATVATNSRAGRIGISVESKTVAPDRGYPLRTSKPRQRCPASCKIICLTLSYLQHAMQPLSQSVREGS